MRKTLAKAMVVLCALCFIACDSGSVEPSSPPYEEPAYDAFTVSQSETVLRLQSTDSLGRYFTRSESWDEEKKVGLFYFLWIGQHDQKQAGADGCAWDSSLLSETQLKGTPANSDVGVFHYWSEPLYDYYNSEDPWVFRKHLELFIMAGIDYLVFDVSNSYYYKTVCDNIFPVALSFVEQGWEIPKFVFYCHNKTKDTVTGIYNDFYNPENESLRKYDALWYTETDNGVRNTERKPWIVVKNNGIDSSTLGAAQNYDKCDEKIKNFFYTRELRWNEEHGAEGNWLFPSDIDDPIPHEGMLSVSVAQHTSGAFSDSVFEANSRDKNRGRGWVWNDGKTEGTNTANNVALGSNYQSEWGNAFAQSSVNNVFLSTWNEWVAQKQPYGANGRSSSYFVDQFNPEFSRDLEMTKGLWGDNYYLQTVQNIRRFKQKTGETVSEHKPRRNAVDIRGGESQWENTVGFCDPAGDTAPRNYQSSNKADYGNVPNTVYVNDTGRNDIVQTRITCDDENLYFRIECADDITQYENGDKTWMNILLEVEGAKGSAWENYQYVINRTVTGDVTYIERLKADGKSEIEAAGELYVSGKVLTVKVPRSAVGLSGQKKFTVNFKVADRVIKYDDIMDYYVNGDSAPIGRLNYTFSV